MNEIYNLNLCDNTFDKELDEISKKIIDEYKILEYV